MISYYFSTGLEEHQPFGIHEYTRVTKPNMELIVKYHSVLTVWEKTLWWSKLVIEVVYTELKHISVLFYILKIPI